MTDEDAIAAIGERLKRLRREAGFKSARAFAEHAGMSVSAYTSYEQGRSNMNLLVAAKIADLLGCTLDEMAGRDVPLDPIPLTPDDVALVERYRSLDDRGRESVDSMIETQRALAGLDGAGLEGVGA